MSRATRVLAAFAVAGLALAPPAHAWFEDTTVGARGVSLGYAVLADADDASALWWNPAGLAQLRQPQLLLEDAKPYDVTGLDAGAVLVAMPAWHTGWAAGWHHLGVSGVYGEELFMLGAGRELPIPVRGHALLAGATLKLGRIAFQTFQDPSTGEQVDFGDDTEASLDVGLRWRTPWSLDLAWVGRDLLQPRYEFIPGTGGGQVPFRHELGAALRWNRESTLTGSWSQIDASHSNINVGLEIRFYDVFAIRTGLTNLKPIADANGSPNEFQFSGGFGVAHKGVAVDASAWTHHDLGASYRASLRVPLGRSR